MLCIGLTGGIGAGKSVVSNIFRHLNISVFDADMEAKKCYEDPEIQNRVIQIWGHEVFINGKLQHQVLADRVFKDPLELKKLEQIIHPLVQLQWINFLDKNKEAKYCIKETAILMNANGHINCDAVIGVFAPRSIKIQRVKKRSGLSTEEIENRISRQWADEQTKSMCHWEITNDGHHSLIYQAMHIHEALLSGEIPALAIHI